MYLTVPQDILEYISGLGALDFLGLIFGLLCVIFLIKENILTWPFGIAYVLISFYIFWHAQLYGDFILHVIFLILNIYGWWNWTKRRTGTAHDQTEDQLSVTSLTLKEALTYLAISIVGIFLFAQFLIWLPTQFEGMPAASLPYWDSVTSVLSVTGIWLQAQKKLDNWYYWLAVNILATGIYFYKDIPFYSLLYFIYIFMAVAGYREWSKSQKLTEATL